MVGAMVVSPVCQLVEAESEMVWAKSVRLSRRACSRLMTGPQTFTPKALPRTGLWLRIPSRVTFAPEARGRTLFSFFSSTLPS